MIDKKLRIRTCNKCRIIKPFVDFHTDKSKALGIGSICKECVKSYRAEYRKKWTKEDKERISAEAKVRYSINKSSLFRKANNYVSARTKIDPVFRLSRNIKRQLRDALTGRQLYTPKCRLFGITGLLYSDLVNYLHSTFELNYGLPRQFINLKEIDIDHITPLSTAITTEDIVRLNHHTNLQLLFKEDNQRKRWTESS